MTGELGAEIGRRNREAVRAYFLAHIGCSQLECAEAIGVGVFAVGRHIKRLRAEWEAPPSSRIKSRAKLR